MTGEEAKKVLGRAAALDASMDPYLRQAMNMGAEALDAIEKLQYSEDVYKKQAEMLKSMITYYRKDEKPIRRNGVWLCPACGKKLQENQSYCHLCGKKIGWEGTPRWKSKDRYKRGGKRR
jgi:rubrerythrin